MGLKKYFSRVKTLLFILTALSSFSGYASVSFSNLNLSENDELLFSAKHNVPGTYEYSSLFVTKLGKSKTEDTPKILTCFPERLELLNEGSILQVRNRYGTAWYENAFNKLTWISYTEKMPVEYTHTGRKCASPNGKWICFVSQEKNAVGKLILQNVENLEQKILVESCEFSYEDVNVKWAPDSNVVLYEKNGSVYFITPSSAFKNIQLPEEYRKIGNGTIHSVSWTSKGEIIYVDNDIVYLIRENELYTRGLYSSLVGSGTITGRLPYTFNSVKDKFFISPDGNQIVIISSEKMISWFSFPLAGYDYVKVNGVFPLTSIKGEPLDYNVFWTSDKKPILWISLLNYGTGKKSSSVYRLSKNVELVLDIMGSSLPVASPDGKHVAFTGGKSLYVYDTTTWKQSAKLSGQTFVSFVWASPSLLYAGGDESVVSWAIDYRNGTGESSVLFLSSAEYSRWDAGRIVSSTASGSYYIYDAAKNIWLLSKKSSVFLSPSGEKNGKFRVFIGEAQNTLYENAVYVRSLSGNVVTYPVFKECDVSNNGKKRVAFAFDAMDSVDGLARILYVLDDFGIKGTFFLNGEFIRRYPIETNQIAASGNECASSFYTTADLTSKHFVIDEDFIKRGLARNEDEFFSVTSKELSLLWHAPWYNVTSLMKNAGSQAGYRYVDAFTNFSDRISFEESSSTGKAYLDAGSLIDSFVENLHDGMVIPVSVGKTNGTRSDYLYEKLDLLIAAILNAGYEIVSVREF